jgi:hypothetical protein
VVQRLVRRKAEPLRQRWDRAAYRPRNRRHEAHHRTRRCRGRPSCHVPDGRGSRGDLRPAPTRLTQYVQPRERLRRHVAGQTLPCVQNDGVVLPRLQRADHQETAAGGLCRDGRIGNLHPDLCPDDGRRGAIRPMRPKRVFRVPGHRHHQGGMRPHLRDAPGETRGLFRWHDVGMREGDQVMDQDDDPGAALAHGPEDTRGMVAVAEVEIDRRAISPRHRLHPQGGARSIARGRSAASALCLGRSPRPVIRDHRSARMVPAPASDSMLSSARIPSGRKSRKPRVVRHTPCRPREFSRRCRAQASSTRSIPVGAACPTRVRMRVRSIQTPL